MYTQDFLAWLEDKCAWSLETFGTKQRTEGVLRHIESEIEEIRQSPNDLMEWVDVILLAFDGAFRAGFSPTQILSALFTKQKLNTMRTWNIPKDDEPSFHIKNGD